MKVPFIDISRWESGFQERWLDKVREMSAVAHFVGGAEIAKLERRLSDAIGADHAIGCANGTDAIQLGLRALGVGKGDIVLLPDATFWATFEAVVNVGAEPITVDISLVDGSVDITALSEAIERERPKAAIIVHLYGWGSQNLRAIRELCKKQGVALLEDGAQCFGATLDGEPLLKGALISTTSFYPAKVLGAAGDAGAVFTDDPDLAQYVRRLGNHGRTSHYGYADVGWNSRLDALQAAFLNLSLDYFEARLASRQESAAVYRRELPKVGLQPMPVPTGYIENGYCNTCLVDQSAKQHLEAVLKNYGVGFGNIYPGSMSSQPGAKPHLRGHYGGDAAAELAKRVINLPLFAYMSSVELDQVIEAVAAAELQ